MLAGVAIHVPTLVVSQRHVEKSSEPREKGDRAQQSMLGTNDTERKLLLDAP